MKIYQIATIPGDGIGQQGNPTGQQVLQAFAAANASRHVGFEFEHFGWGGDCYRAHGVMMLADGLDALRSKDAILFGSAGDPHIPDQVTLWGLRLKSCQGFDQYANAHPARHRRPAQALRPARPGLGHRARKLRRRIRRCRWPRAPRPTDQGGRRREPDDARGPSAHHPSAWPKAGCASC